MNPYKAPQHEARAVDREKLGKLQSNRQVSFWVGAFYFGAALCLAEVGHILFVQSAVARGETDWCVTGVNALAALCFGIGCLATVKNSFPHPRHTQ